MAKTHTAQIAELRALLDEQAADMADLHDRLGQIEAERANSAAQYASFLPLIMPGTFLGDLITKVQNSENPDDVEDIVRGAVEDSLEDMVGHLLEGVTQRVHALAEGHGINPTPKPNLYTLYMKGFNRYLEAQS